MWGKPPFSIADNCAVDVRNLAAVREWYKEKLGLQEAETDREEDSGRPFADLHISNDDTFLSLVELEPGASAESRHVIFFARNLEKAHQWLAGRGGIYTPIMTESSPHFYRQTLEKLAEEPPTTKTALLRFLLPQIQVALRSGKTLKQVWQRLSEDGLDISCETFCRLIRRTRTKPHASAAPSGKSVEEPVASTQATESSLAHDPLANLKRLEANRPGFHWRATKTPR